MAHICFNPVNSGLKHYKDLVDPDQSVKPMTFRLLLEGLIAIHFSFFLHILGTRFYIGIEPGTSPDVLSNLTSMLKST